MAREAPLGASTGTAARFKNEKEGFRVLRATLFCWGKQRTMCRVDPEETRQWDLHWAEGEKIREESSPRGASVVRSRRGNEGRFGTTG